ncbi:hypothetical protein GE061_011777 [Apolygus lucorum]|uniref:SET domain-containing protein n=1 Tax=Apolygus lucorum TaxID=248454 RepID=A0A8S9XYQ4_APOLU|nr:hypothetical protein GE061_011777 [Apolygus lucorum]
MGGRKNRSRSGRSASHRNAEEVISGSSGSWKLNRYLQIKHSDEIGRYLIAADNLLPGTILLQEDPIVIGPNFGLGPTCLRCGKMIHSKKNPISRCERCAWPVCENGCQGVNFNLHSPAECEVLSKAAKIPAENVLFNIITPLRVLLTRRDEPDKWTELQLESHDDIRKLNKDQWDFYQREVVDAFKEVCGFQEFTEDEVHTVCGYLQLNDPI